MEREEETQKAERLELRFLSQQIVAGYSPELFRNPLYPIFCLISISNTQRK